MPSTAATARGSQLAPSQLQDVPPERPYLGERQAMKHQELAADACLPRDANDKGHRLRRHMQQVTRKRRLQAGCRLEEGQE